MGAVYKAEQPAMNRMVAVKILHPKLTNRKDLASRFRREARAASRIGHPNIIDVMDFGTTDDGCAYFIMEHLDGIDPPTCCRTSDGWTRTGPVRSRSRSAGRWRPRTRPA